MYLFAITLLIICYNTINSHGNNIEKCCTNNHYLKESENFTKSYKCSENVNSRLEVVTNSTNFLNRSEDGICYDSDSKEFNIYNISHGEIQKQKLEHGKYFPKCCPLNYLYNSKEHSCVNTTKNFDFIEEKFIKVGLPHCEIIVDYNNFKSIEEINNQLKIIDRVRDGYCVDRNEKDDFVLRICKDGSDYCNKIKCIRKCCPDGQSFYNGSKCVDTYVHGVNLGSFPKNVLSPEDPFAIIHKYKCRRIQALTTTRFNFNLLENGTLSLYYNLTNSYQNFPATMDKGYCIEYAQSKKITAYSFFFCMKDAVQEDKFFYTKWPKLVSCVCLVLTIFIYLLLGETKNLFGKSLVLYCLSVFLVFAILCYGQFVSTSFSDTGCVIIGYLLLFTGVATFTWQNILCWDIWCTFGTPKSIISTQRRRDLKKFLYYNLYGFGIPLILTLIILFFNKTEVLPFVIHPIVGTYSCLIMSKQAGNYAHILFKESPLLILEIINIVLFIKTLSYCLKVKNEINKMNDTVTKGDTSKRFNADKERLSLIFKLLVIMGVSFLFEVVSAFYDMKLNPTTKYIEIVWDFINCCQGIFIFIIFICKKKTYNTFLQKFHLSKLRKISISSSANTQMSVVTPTQKSGK